MTDGDRLACTALVARFFDALDRGDAEAAAMLFAPDGRWHRQGRVLVGPDAIRSAIGARDTARITAHLVTNVVAIAAGADAASVRFYLAAYDNADGGGPRLVTIRRCADRMVRVGADWMIADKSSAALLPAT